MFERITPRCPLFGVCGGCSLQDLAYADQLLLKKQRIERFLAQTGMPGEVGITGLEEPWRYRNKAEFTFGEDNGRLTLGFHAARSFSRIVDLDDCFLLPQPLLKILRDLKHFAQASGFPAYNLRTHQGFFRYAILRQSFATGKIQLCLLTSSVCGEKTIEQLGKVVEGFFERLARDNPSFCSGYWGLTDKSADIAVPDTLAHLYGEAFLKETIGPFAVELHPLTFLQSSTVQAQRLYEAIARGIEAEYSAAWDLYCGIGFISFYLSRRVKRVYGIEQSASSIALAREHARRNGINNAVFHEGPVETVLRNRRFWLKEARPGVVVVDPPRMGLNPAVISSVVCARPAQIGYVSCNVQSLVRDLKLLLSSFPRYRVALVEAFDMFPQTDHVETLVWLKRA